jgi:putative phosphoesterase
VIAIISDTHLPRGRWALPESCLAQLREAELIVHAGDFMRSEILDSLQELGPVLGVHGNADDEPLRFRLPATRCFEHDGVVIGVVHNAGPRAGRLARLRKRFPEADAVIFGHSHVPLHDADEDGFQIFNPGSPTDRRREPFFTMGLGSVNQGRLELSLLRLK